MNHETTIERIQSLAENKIHKTDCACELCEEYSDNIRTSMETL